MEAQVGEIKKTGLFDGSGSEGESKETKGRGNNRLPYGLCERHHITLPDGAKPREAWDALEGIGITPDKAYAELKDKAVEAGDKKRQEETEVFNAAGIGYNSRYYSSITKKQAGVIFAANKQGKINIPDTCINYMYNHFADVRGFNNNHSQQDVYNSLKIGLEWLFRGKYEQAQKSLMRAFTLECTIFDSKDIREMRTVLGMEPRYKEKDEDEDEDEDYDD